MHLLMKLLNMVWKVIRVVLIVFTLIGFFGVFTNTGNQNIWANIVSFFHFLMPLLFVVAIEILKKGYERICPSCKKWFALKEVGTEIVGKEDIHVKVEGNTYNRNREIIGTQEQYVPGTRKIYHRNYKCTKCGEECYSKFSESSANL